MQQRLQLGKSMRHLILCVIDQLKFALELSDVERVIRAVEVTSLPQAQSCMLGVINLHGKIVGVANLRERLGMEMRQLSPSDLFIICKTDHKNTAFWVDSIAGIIACPEEAFLAPEEVILSRKATQEVAFVSAFVKYEDEIVLVLCKQNFHTLG